MPQKKTTKKPEVATSNRPSPRRPSSSWKKPRITRHGNMRQLTQMSG